MHPAARAVLAIAITASLAPPAVAEFKGKTDPDWPCQQIKTPTFSLASVWAGPQLDLDSQSWRNESDVADLKAQMAQRRVPIADVETAVADFEAKAGPDADAKLLRAFAAAFADLSEQRSQIINGLDRIGRKQKTLADRIRAENEAVQNLRTRTMTVSARRGQSERLLWIFASSTIAARPSLTSAGADADRTAHRGDRARGERPLAPVSGGPLGDGSAQVYAVEFFQ